MIISKNIELKITNFNIKNLIIEFVKDSVINYTFNTPYWNNISEFLYMNELLKFLKENIVYFQNEENINKYKRYFNYSLYISKRKSYIEVSFNHSINITINRNDLYIFYIEYIDNLLDYHILYKNLPPLNYLTTYFYKFFITNYLINKNIIKNSLESLKSETI